MKTPRRLVIDVLVLLAIGVVFLLLARPLHRTGFAYDEHWFVWGGWAITAGQTPYVDFTDFKPPVGFLVNAAGIGLLGLDGFAYRYFMGGIVFAGLALFYLALRFRRHEPLLAASLTLLVSYLVLNQRFHDSSLNDVESIGFGFFLAGISLLLMPGTHHWKSITGGALLAAAVLTKEPFVLPAGPAFFACILLTPKSTRSELFSKTLWAAGGGVAFGLATALYLALVGGLQGYLDVVASYGEFAEKYCVAIGVFQHTTFVGDLKVSLSRLHDGLINWNTLRSLSPFLAAGLISAVFLRRAGALMALAAVAGGLYAVTLGHCFWAHYFTMVFGPLALLGAAGADLIADRVMTSRYAWLSRALLTAIVVVTLGPRIGEEVGKEYPVPGSPFSPELMQFIRDTTSPTDRIFTAGEPGIYAFAGRQSALANGIYTDEFLDFSPAPDEEDVAPALAELQKTKPKVVLLQTLLPDRKQRYFKLLFRPYIRSMGYREVSPDLFVLP